MRRMLQLRARNTAAGERIRRLRHDRCWTQEDLAEEIRCHPQLDYRHEISVRTIIRAEQGQKPRLRGQVAIATVLGTTPHELWPDEPRPSAWVVAPV